MKRLSIALFLVACLPLLCAQKTRYGQEPPKAKPGVDYPIKVHISGVRIRTYCDQGCTDYLHAEVVMDQKKLELTGSFLYEPRSSQVNLLPGDYTARLLKANKGEATPLYNQYELLLPDRHLWRCTVTGIFE
jgi:hypothetical protein